MACSTSVSIGIDALLIDILGVIPGTIAMTTLGVIKVYRSPKLINILVLIAIVLHTIPNLAFLTLDILVRVMGPSRPIAAYQSCVVLVPLGYLSGGPMMACNVVISFERGFRSLLPKFSRWGSLIVCVITLILGTTTLALVGRSGWKLETGLVFARIMLGVSALWITTVEDPRAAKSVKVLKDVSSAVNYDSKDSLPLPHLSPPQSSPRHIRLPPGRMIDRSKGQLSTPATFESVRVVENSQPYGSGTIPTKDYSTINFRGPNSGSFPVTPAASWRKITRKMAILLCILGILNIGGFLLLLGFNGSRWQASLTIVVYAVYWCALLMYISCIGDAAAFVRPQ
ncbi:hypothetical protein BJ742DRAFT_780827 [Cladochytrium replicatum]|nr:hypothetical protein BJ742DRAFT_780827 [Cladochytrium replicatum]